MPIVVRIDVELARRKMSVGEFAERVGVTPANVAVLKNGRAKAVRFSTLEAMCRVLECQPGDLLEWVEDTDVAAPHAAALGAEGTRGLVRLAEVLVLAVRLGLDLERRVPYLEVLGGAGAQPVEHAADAVARPAPRR